jgi:branched-chain amino acid transport system ATP-binding protein
MSLFKADAITAGYGGLLVVRNVSFEVDGAEVVALIGANGAGKTTTLKSIAKLISIQSGQIWFQEERIDGLPPHDISRRGLILVPEGRRLFGSMSVIENLEFGVYTQKAKLKKAANLEFVFQHFPRLKGRKNQRAGSLSGGEQEMLAIGRGILAAPKLLLLDEPSLGLAPLIVKDLFNTLEQIAAMGEMAILLSEQNVPKALSVSRRGYIMELGQIVHSGESASLLNDAEVRKAYLGY